MLIKHISCYRSYFGEFTRFTRVSRRHFSCILNFELSRGSGICLHSIRLVYSDILFKASLGKNYATLSTEQRRHYSLCKSRTKVAQKSECAKHWGRGRHSFHLWGISSLVKLWIPVKLFEAVEGTFRKFQWFLRKSRHTETTSQWNKNIHDLRLKT